MSDNSNPYGVISVAVQFDTFDIQGEANNLLRTIRAIGKCKAALTVLQKDRSDPMACHACFTVDCSWNDHQRAQDFITATLASLRTVQAIGFKAKPIQPSGTSPWDVVKFKERPDFTINGVHWDVLSV